MRCHSFATHQHKQENQYNNNGKTNPDDVVLCLYTTYDSNSFRPISITSYPMILVQIRGFGRNEDIDIARVVELQIIIFHFWKKTKVAVDDGISPRPQLINPRIQIL